MSAQLPFPAATGLPLFLWQQLKRIGPLGAIILLHIAFFYALQSGLLQQTVEAVPKEVMVTFITPESKPEAPKPQPAPPKTVPVVKKAVPRPPTPAPVVNNTPSQQAITAPPVAPAPPTAEPAAPVVAAPAPQSAGPRTITSGIEYLQAPQPEYPAMSRRLGEEGKAVLRILVNEKGRPERVDVQKTSGSARLDEAARHAAMRAVFKPFMEDGKAVAAYAIVPISFQLNN